MSFTGLWPTGSFINDLLNRKLKQTATVSKITADRLEKVVVTQSDKNIIVQPRNAVQTYQ